MLLISRLQENINPRCVPLKTMDMWVQVYDMQPGFLSDKVLMEIENQIDIYVSSCLSNYKGVWREYIRIRVTMDVTKSLKRKMKVRKSGNEWSWINFKYEHLPTFCFICGVMGHSDKFCSRVFEVVENEITRSYGVWMRAPLRRQNNLIGSKWLRNGTETMAAGEERTGEVYDPRIGEIVGTDMVNAAISKKDRG